MVLMPFPMAKVPAESREVGQGTSMFVPSAIPAKHLVSKVKQAAINQLAFGANPSVFGAGGPGGACGVCYWLTPVSTDGVALSANALIFKIIDECPASVTLSGGEHCNQCTTSEVSTFSSYLPAPNVLTRKKVNDMGQSWHFDIAVDAMSTDQYNQFFNGVTDGSNWYQVYFEQTDCGDSNPAPPVKNWGCVSGCSNNEAATVCENTGFSKF